MADHRPADNDRAVGGVAAVGKHGDVAGLDRATFRQWVGVLTQDGQEAGFVSVHVPVGRVMVKRHVRNQADGGKDADQQVGAVNADALEARGMVKRRADPLHSLDNNIGARGGHTAVSGVGMYGAPRKLMTLLNLVVHVACSLSQPG